jgi:hypothetical protein
MSQLPGNPFTTEDFSKRGGGIDFLGLRWVNLTIVGEHLIPELNNVTTDMGTTFLAGWIPWKFRQLCRNEKDYTEKNYKAFREKVEVALSLTLQHKDLDRPCGLVRNRIGITQRCELPGELSFKSAKRTNQNSLYAAAIYGPALASLGMVKTYSSLAREGAKPLKIAVAGDDPDALQIISGVDRSLRQTSAYQLLASLGSAAFTQKDISKLAEAGLDPARYRHSDCRNLKTCFRRKLLPTEPTDQGYARTLTTRLLLATLEHQNPLTTDQVRNTWYTGILRDRKRLRLTDTALAEHVQRWSCFMARQYQRYPIELFLWCFEDAVSHANRSLDDIIAYWTDRTRAGGLKLQGSFEQLARDWAGSMYQADELATSRAWNNQVHREHERFEFVPEPEDDLAIIHGLRMFAGWYWRLLARQQDAKTKDLMSLGGSDRMSMAWFLKWIKDRKAIPLRDMLRDIFSDLVFSQHMRIALARFDGTAQRLRFLIGDSGIERSVSARRDFANLRLPWMPDRLGSLTALLCDCDVLAEQHGALTPGLAASTVT